MKKYSAIFTLCLAFIACKEDPKTSNTDLKDNSFITIKGDFIYDAEHNAAIFETLNGSIYTVLINKNMHLLNNKVKPFKKHKYTSVPVTVRAKKTKNTNPNIMWEYTLEIKNILKVEKPNPKKEDVIKLSN